MTHHIAVFVAEDWLNRIKLTSWAKSLPRRCIVFTTDEQTDGNTTLSRQFRCSGVLHAIVRTPGVPKNRADFDLAWARRDDAMVAMAHEIIDFGRLPGGTGRFLGREVRYVAELDDM